MKNIIDKIEHMHSEGIDMDGVLLKRSGALWGHGLLEESLVGDLDFIVTDKVGEQLDGAGWKKSTHRNTGDIYYRRRGMEAFSVWRSNGIGEPVTFSEARKRAHKEKLHRELGWRLLIDCPLDVRDEKWDRMRKRDPEHIAYIETWLEENPDFLRKCAWARQLRRIDQARDTLSDAVDLATGAIIEPVQATLGNVAVMSHRLIDKPVQTD